MNVTDNFLTTKNGIKMDKAFLQQLMYLICFKHVLSNCMWAHS